MITENKIISESIAPVQLVGPSNDAIANYGYNPYKGKSAAFISSPVRPKANTFTVYLTQNFQNQFALTMITGGSGGNEGSLKISLSYSNLGKGVGLLLQDDPFKSPVDFGDSLQNSGVLNWRWGKDSTDGAVLGIPSSNLYSNQGFDFTEATLPFQITITILEYENITSWELATDTSGNVAFITLPLEKNKGMTLSRFSCFCGNGIVEKFEDCDAPNSSCCTSDCKFASASIVCRSTQEELCLKEEYCTGTSAICPQEVSSQCATNSTTCDNLSCSQCAENPTCGWCCTANMGAGKCVPGSALGPDVSSSCVADSSLCGPGLDSSVSCPYFHYQKRDACQCNDNCTSSCFCGTCLCPEGTAGESCELQRGCDNIYSVSGTEAKIGVCGTCSMDDTSCFGCDGKPFGEKNDTCGVCGGENNSCFDPCISFTCEDCAAAVAVTGCVWCETYQMCTSLKQLQNGTATCPENGRVTDLTQCVGESIEIPVVVPAVVGSVAALIVGAVVILAAVLLAGVGVKAGYHMWVNRNTETAPILDNPLYEAPTSSHGNPLYEPKAD